MDGGFLREWGVVCSRDPKIRFVFFLSFLWRPCGLRKLRRQRWASIMFYVSSMIKAASDHSVSDPRRTLCLS